jgi:hypothetical protein
LLAFDVQLGYPAGPPTFLGDQAIALFNAAGPCDLTCFIGALNGQTWQTFGGNNRLTSTINIGAPLNGSLSVSGSGPLRSFNISGTYRVSGPVPEPGTWLLMLLGFGSVGFALRRNTKSGPQLLSAS